MANKTVKVTIAFSSLLKVVLVGLLLWFFYAIHGVLAILFVAIIIASALDPVADWFTAKKIPRFLGVLAIYVVLFALISLILILLVPPAIYQIQNLVKDFPEYWSRVSSGVSTIDYYSTKYHLGSSFDSALKQLDGLLSSGSNSLIGTISDIFGGIFSFLVVLVITFYLLLEEGATKRTLRLVTPAKYQPYLTKIVYKMQEKIGLWLRGQILLSFIIGLIVYIAMNIFGLFYPIYGKYALVLALLAFIFEFIPYLGPILAAIPALFIGLTYSWGVAGAVLVFYWAIQWVENNIIVPQVMKRAVGLNPIIIIVAMMIGAKLGGVVGIMLAIPVTTALSVIADEVFKEIDRRGDDYQDAE